MKYEKTLYSTFKVLEREHTSLETRRVVAKQNMTSAQSAYDSLARKLAENETYVQVLSTIGGNFYFS